MNKSSLASVWNTISGIPSLFSYLSTENSNPRYDPLSSLIKIALLEFKPKGTRLSFQKYTFSYEEPTRFQPIQRYALGEDQSDIAKLESPINLAISLYSPENPSIKTIFERAIQGLMQLKETYNPDDRFEQKKIQRYQQTQHSLETYIRSLQDALNRGNSKDKPDNCPIPLPIDYKQLWINQEIDWIATGLTNMKNLHQNNELRWRNTMNAVYMFALGVDSTLQEMMDNH